MSKKIVVYTAIFGSDYGLIKQPKFKDVDYICYTDQKHFTSKIWKIVYVDPPVKNDNTRSNRYYKILPHTHLSKAYDYSVYIDGNVLIIKNIVNLVMEKMQYGSFACFDHSKLATDSRNCIYKEYLALVNIAFTHGIYKDDLEVMKRQITRFRDENYPENNGLVTAPILIRKHFDATLINVMQHWWTIVKNESKRDQLSFNYVIWKLNFKHFSFIPGGARKKNPWFYTMNHRKKYTSKIIKFKLKRFLHACRDANYI